MGSKKHGYNLSTIVLLLTLGSIFTALGIALTVIIIDGVIKIGITAIGAGILMPIVLICALLGFGITALVFGGKQIYFWIKTVKTEKSGKIAVAQIIGQKYSSSGRKINTHIRYALILSYNDGTENKEFTTDYLYDINEYKYLKKLKSIKIKVNGSFVAICEPLPEEIYKLDSNYGIEASFYKQKPVAILFRLWVVFFLLAVVFFIISIVVGNSILVKASVIILFAVHFPFVIPLAIYLIKWIKRKK